MKKLIASIVRPIAFCANDKMFKFPVGSVFYTTPASGGEHKGEFADVAIATWWMPFDIYEG